MIYLMETWISSSFTSLGSHQTRHVGLEQGRSHRSQEMESNTCYYRRYLSKRALLVVVSFCDYFHGFIEYHTAIFLLLVFVLQNSEVGNYHSCLSGMKSWCDVI